MPVLQRLLKLIQDKQAIKNSNSTKNNNEISNQDEVGKREIIHSNNQNPQKKSSKRERINLECNELNKNLAALIRRHHLRAWFSNTLYTYPVSVKKDDIVRGYKKSVSNAQSPTSSTTTTHNVRIEVLPISDTSNTSSTRRCKKKIGNGDQNKPKPMPKMKELIRWSAASKSYKQTGIKVSHFRNGGSVNGLGGESPKISLTLIQEGCTTVGSDHCRSVHEKGNWITSDDEFVVLEL